MTAATIRAVLHRAFGLPDPAGPAPVPASPKQFPAIFAASQRLDARRLGLGGAITNPHSKGISND